MRRARPRARIFAAVAATASLAVSTADAQTTGMAGGVPMHVMTMDDMTSAFGAYPMSREGSGTSWQPDATPIDMLHVMNSGWALMMHGYASFIEDRQTGPRGDSRAFSESMLMLMADRPLGPGTIGLRSMLSLDPLMGKNGYPLLYQTGETADGKTPLIDRQHPHDALMELSTSYALTFEDDRAAFVYAGLPGEPALGPTAFMHRFSGMRNPEAPITHHWFDATHVSFGVVTAGASQGPLKIEGSVFNGREPDQFRWNIETRRLDSWSTRVSYNPTPDWALQASYGYMKSPEALEPDTRVRRMTASATWQTRLAANPWATTLAWARNDKRGASSRNLSPAILLESTCFVADKHTWFGRFEAVDKDELFAPGQPLYGESFKVKKLSLGYIYDFAATGPLRWGIGGVVGVLSGPAALDAAYGRNPMSYLVFLQARIDPR
jgi:hypothetical protein